MSHFELKAMEIKQAISCISREDPSIPLGTIQNAPLTVSEKNINCMALAISFRAISFRSSIQ
jgi:hypothetical protein